MSGQIDDVVFFVSGVRMTRLQIQRVVNVVIGAVGKDVFDNIANGELTSLRAVDVTSNVFPSPCVEVPLALLDLMRAAIVGGNEKEKAAALGAYDLCVGKPAAESETESEA